MISSKEQCSAFVIKFLLTILLILMMNITSSENVVFSGSSFTIAAWFIISSKQTHKHNNKISFNKLVIIKAINALRGKRKENLKSTVLIIRFY